MLKKTITFQNFEGDIVSEDWFFNLSIAEIAKMTLVAGEDLVARLQKIVDSKDGAKIIEAFEDVIKKSVGKKSDDGKRFLKSPAITEEFMGSEAYSQFFIELVTNATAAVEFINGVLPSDLAEKAAALQKANLPDMIDNPDGPPRSPLTPDDFSYKEMLEMSEDNLKLLGDGKMYDKPGVIRDIKDYTQEELLAMSDSRFLTVAGRDQKKWDKSTLVIAMMRKTQK